ncbi:hypothetical protein [Paenibacillus wynnii]|uniref:hypothetical protein n=1 Tax=Paenibacillus wynnii TaxID=268407 RepID=UPI0027914A99|nr:hypothetical protein [Paenibacillus wynnii]MDQ0194806.1 hypothetical protein [Paenibacillus wynnii]
MVVIIEKQRFSVIGKMGKGFSSEGSIWIPPLWQEANKNFVEISNLAKLDAEGNIVGNWGAMSDVSGNFERWKEEGKYLAGCEVTDNATPQNNYQIVGAFQEFYNPSLIIKKQYFTK